MIESTRAVLDRCTLLEAGQCNHLVASFRAATPAARAFAREVLRLIVEDDRQPSLVEIYAILAPTVGNPNGLSPAEGDALNSALGEVCLLPYLPPLAAARIQAVSELVFHHFPNPFTVCCD